MGKAERVVCVCDNLRVKELMCERGVCVSVCVCFLHTCFASAGTCQPSSRLNVDGSIETEASRPGEQQKEIGKSKHQNVLGEMKDP